MYNCVERRQKKDLVKDEHLKRLSQEDSTYGQHHEDEDASTDDGTTTHRSLTL